MGVGAVAGGEAATADLTNCKEDSGEAKIIDDSTSADWYVDAVLTQTYRRFQYKRETFSEFHMIASQLLSNGHSVAICCDNQSLIIYSRDAS